MKYLAGPIASYLNTHETTIDQLPFSLDQMHALLTALTDDTITDHQAKSVIKDMLTGKSVADSISDRGFDSTGLDDDALRTICQ
jgi:Asp-tRNA(Asn)/Glu-tRNA(Gln) amidotransferase B subunit